MNCIIALTGIYPSRDGSNSSDPWIGEIKWVPYNFAPGGWAFCDGQLLPISGNGALFSLLGTTYGGDGNGPGLTNRILGTKYGTETETLSTTQIPSHSHPIP